MREIWVRSLTWEDPLEKGMATHSSVLAWRIPQTEQPGGLQSLGSQRVRHNCVTHTRRHTHTHTHTHTQVFHGGPVCHCPVERFWWEKAERWKMKWTQHGMLRTVIQDLLAKSSKTVMGMLHSPRAELHGGPRCTPLFEHLSYTRYLVFTLTSSICFNVYISILKDAWLSPFYQRQGKKLWLILKHHALKGLPWGGPIPEQRWGSGTICQI